MPNLRLLTDILIQYFLYIMFCIFIAHDLKWEGPSATLILLNNWVVWELSYDKLLEVLYAICSILEMLA